MECLEEYLILQDKKKLPQSYRRQVGLLMYLHDRTPPGRHHHECHPHYWQSNPLKYQKIIVQQTYNSTVTKTNCEILS